MTTPIPSPPGLPFLGNVFDVDPQNTLESLDRLADIYGMFRLLFRCLNVEPYPPRPHF